MVQAIWNDDDLAADRLAIDYDMSSEQAGFVRQWVHRELDGLEI